MHTTMEDRAKLLFRWALGIFSITIVIGILNGLDVWEPSRKTLLTHVHAGTLGWITIAVVGVALLIFGGEADDAATKSGHRMAKNVVGATAIYVLTFASTTGILRPIAGTLMLLAIIEALIWVGKRWMGATTRTVPGLGMFLAMISLTLGAILGVLLGIFISEGSLPGLDTATAGNLAGAHPPAMLVGYLILAGVVVVEYFLDRPGALASESRSGVAMVSGLFLAGLLFNIAFIADVEPLIQAGSMLQIVGVLVFVVRMRKHLVPSAWSNGGTSIYGRMSVVYLVVGIGLLVYLVQLLVSGEINPEAGEGAHIILAFDHVMFIGVMTNALFLALASSWPFDGMQKLIFWGTNVGLAVFVAGLLNESSLLKQVSTPVMGTALLVGVYAFSRGRTEETSGG